MSKAQYTDLVVLKPVSSVKRNSLAKMWEIWQIFKRNNKVGKGSQQHN
jgi:hypothetical protein